MVNYHLKPFYFFILFPTCITISREYPVKPWPLNIFASLSVILITWLPLYLSSSISINIFFFIWAVFQCKEVNCLYLIEPHWGQTNNFISQIWRFNQAFQFYF